MVARSHLTAPTPSLPTYPRLLFHSSTGAVVLAVDANGGFVLDPGRIKTATLGSSWRTRTPANYEDFVGAVTIQNETK